MDYYISDTHFGHEGIIRFCDRPFADAAEMDRALIANWNARVGPDDDVWMLGDVMHAQRVAPAHYLEKLAGRKHLIIGNHDESNVTVVDPATGAIPFDGFFETIDYALMCTDDKNRKIWMSHYPLLEALPRGAWMLYGHVHNHRSIPAWDLLRNMDRALNCCVEVNGYMPVTFEELVANNERWKREKHEIG